MKNGIDIKSMSIVICTVDDSDFGLRTSKLCWLFGSNAELGYGQLYFMSENIASDW